MKYLVYCIILITSLGSCKKTIDDTNNNCTSNCTTLSGKFVSANNEPVPNIKVSLSYNVGSGPFGGGYTRKIVNVISDQNGNFIKNFYIKDHELGDTADGYFLTEIDDSKIDNSRYIRTNNLIGTTTTIIDFAIYSITRRDTVINKIFYVPKKAYIKVNLNNFSPISAGDYFEVQSLYPFGPNIGVNTFLNSSFSTGFSGYGNFQAKGLNTQVTVFVAEEERNIIRIFRRKNGLNTSEDFPVFIPKNNSIELTYNY
jgi:hypothetical protein